jgi:hypothetical protein
MKSLRSNSSLQKLNSGAFWYPSIWFNTSIAPFNVKDCRLAVSAAIDRAQYVKVRLNGVGEVATSVVGKNNDMYNKAGFQGFDLAKAKTLAGTCATAFGIHFPNRYQLGLTGQHNVLEEPTCKSWNHHEHQS